MLRMFVREAERLVLRETLPVSLAEAVNPVIWYDLLEPTAEEVRQIEAVLGLAIPTRDEMDDIELSARLYQENGANFMTLTALIVTEGGEPGKTPITFILKDKALVTVRYAVARPFDLFVARTRYGGAVPQPTSGETIMLGLIEALTDRLADILERVGNEIDVISRSVFRGQTGSAQKKTNNLQSLIEQLGQKGDFLGGVRESVVSISRLVTYHAAALEGPGRKPTKESRQTVKLLQRDATQLGDHAAFLSGKVNFLLDATLGLINLEQNQIIKIFTVASVVFLPPTLVASVYGMNFELMPELQWHLGYPWAIALMIASAALPFFFFKRRGWL